MINVNKISNILILVLVLAIFSYPITSSIFHLFNIDSSKLNTIIKSGFAIVYLIYFTISFIYRGNATVTSYSLLFLLSLYSFRLLIDVFFYDINSIDYTQNYLLLYFFMLTLVPVFSILKSGVMLNIRKFNIITGLMLIIINLLYLTVTFYSGLSLEDQVATRLNVQSIDSDKAVISPISISLFGACIISYGFFNLLFSKLKIKAFSLYILMISMGLLNLIIGASRGPFIATILLISFMTVVFFINQKKSFPNYFKNGLVIGLIILFSNLFILPIVKDLDIFIFDRIFRFFEFNSLEERNYVIDSSINDFLNNPFFGSHIFDSKYNAFPHNVIIDALMSLGIVGGVLIIMSLISYLKNLISLFSKKTDFNYGLLLCSLSPIIILGLSSGSFLFMPEFWITLSLITIKFKQFKN